MSHRTSGAVSSFALQSLHPPGSVLFKSWSWEAADLVTAWVRNCYWKAAQSTKPSAFFICAAVKAQQRFQIFACEAEVFIWYCTHQYPSMRINPPHLVTTLKFWSITKNTVSSAFVFPFSHNSGRSISHQVPAQLQLFSHLADASMLLSCIQEQQEGNSCTQSHVSLFFREKVALHPSLRWRVFLFLCTCTMCMIINEHWHSLKNLIGRGTGFSLVQSMCCAGMHTLQLDAENFYQKEQNTFRSVLRALQLICWIGHLPSGLIMAMIVPSFAGRRLFYVMLVMLWVCECFCVAPENHWGL